jgi:ECF sigma factor
MPKDAANASVTFYLNLLKAGDQAAAEPLWERYFTQLVRRARLALGAAPRGAADEEDIALSAFHSFCRGVEDGRFPRLDNRYDLWRVLLSPSASKPATSERPKTSQSWNRFLSL